jgi:aryl-alcohol dehydrogenase-like predicted oxidoreductase
MEGASESVIGKYLARNPGVRDRLVMASKFALTMDPADPHNGGTSRKAVSAPRADAHPLPRADAHPSVPG